MRRYVYIGLCLLCLYALTACENVVQDAGETVVAEETTIDAQPSPQAEAQPSGEVENAVEPPETPPSAEAEARPLTEDELRQWSEFLSQGDCYGFLMSGYDTPLDADLGQVFYNGADVGEYPTDEMVADYLDENGFEEAYTDITFIPYDAASEILERRTGYTLEHFKLAGNDIPMYYSQKYGGYFQMAGDTNRMAVECVSGRLNPDGSVFLESREKSWSEEPDDNFTSTFETTLRPDAQGRGMVFDSNSITGGWLSWAFDEDEIE